MKTQNFGPCSVIDCTNTNVKFRVITELAFEKCHKNQMLQKYPYLEIGRQLCHPHYCKIIEADCNQRRKILKKKKKSIQEKKKIESRNNNCSGSVTVFFF
jgi:hypothetical protein